MNLMQPAFIVRFLVFTVQISDEGAQGQKPVGIGQHDQSKCREKQGRRIQGKVWNHVEFKHKSGNKVRNLSFGGQKVRTGLPEAAECLVLPDPAGNGKNCGRVFAAPAPAGVFAVAKLTISLSSLLSRFIYHPFWNRILRNILKAIPGLPVRARLNPSGILRFSFRNGVSVKLETNQTCHVTTVLFWEGCSRYEFTDIFLDIFPRIEGFFDLGSNIGYYSVLAARANPGIRVHAFDPSPGPFAYLTRNIALNHLAQVEANQAAVSDEDGQFSFHIAWNAKYPWLQHNTLGGSGHLSHVRENPTRHHVQVKAWKLDTYVREKDVRHMDLIKMDVEEAEHLVLAGATESIRRFRPVIVCEVFSTEMMQKIRQSIVSLGYRSYLFTGPGLEEVQLNEDSAVSRIENFFFVPEEKTGLVEKWIQPS